MKLSAVLALLPALALAAPSNFQVVARQSTSGTSSLSYDPKYDVGSTSLNTVACSDGQYGLVTEGYTTFDSLPSFYRIGGSPTIPGWGSPNCGECYQLTYTAPTGGSNSIYITAVDAAPGGFNVGVQAFNELTNGGQDIGRVDVSWTEVARENCGLKNRD
ncbi:Cerato-platanin-domain-containing protein [Aspergillus pseudoustus]|uniref:Cerato-platanin-domain-containing protein n=1 Tax=Aspergillus pseudoustus TaxID=1810923 RepID=A0ABR4IIT9_9EURO